MELLERQAQLEALQSRLQTARDGSGKLIFVTGEAGVGKSSLIETFVDRLGDGVRVLWGSCDALQTPRVLGPVHEIAALLPSLTELGAKPARERLFTGLLEELGRHPVSVVVLEDLHWADEATLDFVIFLGRRIQRTPSLLIATFRDDELSLAHPLRGTLGELTGQHIARLRLPPLSRAAVARLAAESGRNGARVFAITAGNPFFVREVLAATAEDIPETVRDAVIARLTRCRADARTVAELVSISPGKTEPWLLAAVLGDAQPGVDGAIGCGLLQYQADSIAFRHELARLAIESILPPARTREMHERVLHALQAHGADLSRLVHHAERAGDIPALLDYAPRAGRDAARLNAHREAAAHFAVAVRCGGNLPPLERAELLELHARECHLTNQIAPAIESAGQALLLWQALENTEGQARALRILSRQHWEAGNKAEADRHVARAIELLERLPHGPDLAMAYSARSQLAMLEGRVDEALDFGHRAMELARTFNDAEIESYALNNIGSALLGSGDEAGYTLLERSLAIALQHGLTEHAGRAYANLTTCSILRHDFTRAGKSLEQGIAYCEEHEIHTHLAYLRAYGVRLEFEVGKWAEAADKANVLLRNEQLTAVQRIPTLIALALVRARRGDPGVDELLDEALQLALPTRELQRVGRVAAARAEYAWYRGDSESVLREISTTLDIALGHRDPWIKGELLFWKSRVGLVDPLPVDVAEPYRLMIAGEWQAAARAWKDIGMPYERALALSLDAEEKALRESLELLTTLGAGPLAGMVRRRLREQGARSVPRGPRATTRRNPAGLTSREVEVLSLLAGGHTNTQLARRLHLSAKTVDHHVSAILGKLEVRTRTEAVSAAYRLGIVDTSAGG